MTFKTRTRPVPAARWRVSLCAAACALAVAQGARAQTDEPNPYTLGVLETITHDSNVFRAPPGPEVTPDWISTTGIIGSIDQQISRQHLKGNGELDLDRFKNQKQLDSTAHSVSLEDDWTSVGRLAGEVGASDSSQLYRYSLNSTETLTTRDTLHTSDGFARVHLGVVTRLTFDLGFEAFKQDYSAQQFRYEDLTRRAATAGVTWQSSPDLRTSLSYRHTTGEYPNYLTELDGEGNVVTLGDSFTRHDIILGVVYNASGASQFHFNLSRATENHSLVEIRSHSDWAADGQWIWTPTGKTQLSLDFVRDNDTGSEDLSFFGLPIASSDATRRTAVTGKLGYQLTSKVGLTASGSFAHRTLDTLITGEQAAANGSDKTYLASLGVNYAATRAIQLGCNFSREKRTVQGTSITIVTYPYNATVYSCTGQIAFN